MRECLFHFIIPLTKSKSLKNDRSVSLIKDFTYKDTSSSHFEILLQDNSKISLLADSNQNLLSFLLLFHHLPPHSFPTLILVENSHPFTPASYVICFLFTTLENLFLSSVSPPLLVLKPSHPLFPYNVLSFIISSWVLSDFRDKTTVSQVFSSVDNSFFSSENILHSHSLGFSPPQASSSSNSSPPHSTPPCAHCPLLALDESLLKAIVTHLPLKEQQNLRNTCRFLHSHYAFMEACFSASFQLYNHQKQNLLFMLWREGAPITPLSSLYTSSPLSPLSPLSSFSPLSSRTTVTEEWIRSFLEQILSRPWEEKSQAFFHFLIISSLPNNKVNGFTLLDLLSIYAETSALQYDLYWFLNNEKLKTKLHEYKLPLRNISPLWKEKSFLLKLSTWRDVSIYLPLLPSPLLSSPLLSNLSSPHFLASLLNNPLSSPQGKLHLLKKVFREEFPTSFLIGDPPLEKLKSVECARGGLCLDEPGIGKTVTILSLLLLTRRERFSDFSFGAPVERSLLYDVDDLLGHIKEDEVEEKGEAAAIREMEELERKRRRGEMYFPSISPFQTANGAWMFYEKKVEELMAAPSNESIVFSSHSRELLSLLYSTTERGLRNEAADKRATVKMEEVPLNENSSESGESEATEILEEDSETLKKEIKIEREEMRDEERRDVYESLERGEKRSEKSRRGKIEEEMEDEKEGFEEEDDEAWRFSIIEEGEERVGRFAQEAPLRRKTRISKPSKKLFAFQMKTTAAIPFSDIIMDTSTSLQMQLKNKLHRLYYYSPSESLTYGFRKVHGIIEPLRQLFLTKINLIVIPIDLRNHWIDQITRHVKEEFRPVVLHDHQLKKMFRHPQELAVSNCEILFVSFSFLQKEKPNLQNGTSILSHLHFKRIIVDEAHALSASLSPTNRKVALESLSSSHKWFLSGTPVRNRNDISPFHSICDFLFSPYTFLPVNLWTKYLIKVLIPTRLTHPPLCTSPLCFLALSNPSSSPISSSFHSSSSNPPISSLSISDGDLSHTGPCMWKEWGQIQMKNSQKKSSLCIVLNLLQRFSVRTVKSDWSYLFPSRTVCIITLSFFSPFQTNTTVIEGHLPLAEAPITTPPSSEIVSESPFLREAQNYNRLCELVARNLLLADWCDASHPESLLHAKRRIERRQVLDNLIKACCISVDVQVVVDPGHLVEVLHACAQSFAARREQWAQERVDESLLASMEKSKSKVSFVEDAEWVVIDEETGAVRREKRNLERKNNEEQIDGRSGLKVVEGKKGKSYLERKWSDSHIKKKERDQAEMKLSEARGQITPSELEGIDEEALKKWGDMNRVLVFLKEKYMLSREQSYRLHVINNALVSGKECERCGMMSYQLIVIPHCTHLLCSHCVSSNKTHCLVCGRPYLLDKHFVPYELIELQPAFSPPSLFWKSRTDDIFPPKISYLIKQVRKTLSGSTDGKILIHSNFIEHIVYIMDVLERFMHYHFFDEDHLKGVKSFNRKSKYTVRQRFGFDPIPEPDPANPSISSEAPLCNVDYNSPYVCEFFSPMPTEKKNQMLKLFQTDPHARIIICDKSISHGQNLTNVELILLLEPITDSLVFEQLISRSHRIGMTRPVHVIVLTMKDTVEELISHFLARSYSGLGREEAMEAAEVEGKEDEEGEEEDREEDNSGEEEETSGHEKKKKHLSLFLNGMKEFNTSARISVKHKLKQAKKEKKLKHPVKVIQQQQVDRDTTSILLNLHPIPL